MEKRRKIDPWLWIYLVVGLYIVFVVVTDLLYVFRVPPYVELWVSYAYIEDFVTAAVGLAAAYLLLSARARIKERSAERPILLLTGVGALFLGLSNILTGSSQAFIKEVTFETSSRLNFTNVAPLIGFLLASFSIISAVVILVRNSYWILSKGKLVAAGIISILLLCAFGFFIFVPITSIELEGLVKAGAVFISLMSLVSFAGVFFALSAFGRGRGRRFWGSLSLGIMLISVSALLFFFVLATGVRWMGISLIGMTAGLVLMSQAGYYRWKLLKR